MTTRVYIAVGAGAALLLGGACGTVSGDGPEGAEQSASPDTSEATGTNSGPDEVPMCSLGMDTDPPGPSDIEEAHEAGVDDYGAETPSDLIERLAEGRNPVTNREGGVNGPIQEHFADMLEHVNDADYANTQEYESVEIRGEGDDFVRATVVSDRWFVTSWSAPIPCSPFSIEPFDERHEQTMLLDADTDQAASGDVVSFTATDDGPAPGALDVYEWSQDDYAWQLIDEQPTNEITIDNDWPEGDSMVCEADYASDHPRCGSLEILN